ncbi:MAG: chorismate-binding protein, partial [Bacteriovoracaceae bacterium]
KNVWCMPLSLGAYALCSFISELNQLFLSNSPECLFQVRNQEGGSSSIYSMPIKGTIKINEESERKKAWSILKNSLKDQAELYMITDLVRNDLTRVQMSPAQTRSKKLPLHVPGIVHQYSIVESAINGPLNLRDALKGLFPGGSVTGAPKKRVLKILRDLEEHERGFYCGSTVILHRNLKAASINIRSCEIDFSSREMKYCAGGAITLNSEVQSEFDETYAKMESFLQLLKK